MEKINAVITGVGGYVPDYILTNDEISKMVDTNDEWIMTRIGVKERPQRRRIGNIVHGAQSSKAVDAAYGF